MKNIDSKTISFGSEDIARITNSLENIKAHIEAGKTLWKAKEFVKSVIQEIPWIHDPTLDTVIVNLSLATERSRKVIFLEDLQDAINAWEKYFFCLHQELELDEKIKVNEKQYGLKYDDYNFSLSRTTEQRLEIVKNKQDSIINRLGGHVFCGLCGEYANVNSCTFTGSGYVCDECLEKNCPPDIEPKDYSFNRRIFTLKKDGLVTTWHEGHKIYDRPMSEEEKTIFEGMVGAGISMVKTKSVEYQIEEKRAWFYEYQCARLKEVRKALIRVKPGYGYVIKINGQFFGGISKNPFPHEAYKYNRFDKALETVNFLGGEPFKVVGYRRAVESMKTRMKTVFELFTIR